MKLHLFCLLPLLLLLAACQDEEEPIPAYLRIEPFSVNAVGGAGWQKITEGWLYADDVFLGGYSLPATVPVLADGDVDVLVFPGVKENGQTQTPALYPFLERYSAKVTLRPAETKAIQPVTAYDAGVILPWPVERGSFNNAPIVLENRDTDTANFFVLTTNGAFEGRSVLLEVDTAHAILEIATEQVANLPASAERQVWLEMHYRNDLPFQLWLLGTTGSSSNELSQPVYQFSVSENWNKIYLNLTDFLIALQQEKHRLFFRVVLSKNANGNYDQTQGKVLLDNIRLLHF
ncbi:MAG: hypothetical protein IPH12_09100 [Saprospirales bacterium]|nr:hypothetical protein [Saprospirales bacterium]MBK8920991.1 hypothetical protein [Saprospirales bacterium]